MSLELSKIAKDLTFENPPLPLVSNPEEVPYFINAVDTQLNVLHKKNDLLLPNFKDMNQINVFSDYAGDQKSYQSYSFLFVSSFSTKIFTERMVIFRKENNINMSEFKFKNRSNNAARFGQDFIDIFGNMSALQVTILVDKSVPSLYAEKSFELREKIREMTGLDESPKMIERMLIISQTIGYFLSLVSQNCKMFLWQSDRDKIFDTKKRIDLVVQSTLGMMDHFGCKVDDFKHGESIEVNDIESAAFRDLLSIPDLISGTLADIFHNSHFDSSDTLTSSTKSHAYSGIAELLSGQRLAFRHITILACPSKTSVLPSISVANFNSTKNDATLVLF